MIDKVKRFWRTNPKIIYALILSIMFFYWIPGAYPIVPIETDSMRIVLGTQQKTLYGDDTYAYRYETRAGTYKLVQLSASIFRLDYFRIFSYLSTIACLVFLIFSVLLLKRVSNSLSWTCLVSLLIFQETYVSGYYPNSTILAAAFLTSALFLATQKEKVGYVVLSSLLFSISVWVRFDAILIGGAFIVLLWGSNKLSIRTIFVFSVFFFAASTLLFIASKVSLLDILKDYLNHTADVSDLGNTLKILSTNFTLVTVYFFGLGLYYLVCHKKWRLIALFLLGALPLILAYGLSLVSPKYLLYTLTFFAIPLSYALTLLVKDRTRRAERLIFVGIVLFIGQYIFTPAYELILNRSAVIHTADGKRLIGAIAYNPIYWAKGRQAAFNADRMFQRKLTEYLQQTEPSFIISQDWMANQWSLYFLQKIGYRVKDSAIYSAIPSEGDRLILERGSDIVYLVRWLPESSLDLPSGIRAEIQEMASILYIGPISTTADYARNSFLSEEFKEQRQPDWGRFDAILFQR